MATFSEIRILHSVKSFHTLCSPEHHERTGSFVDRGVDERHIKRPSNHSWRRKTSAAARDAAGNSVSIFKNKIKLNTILKEAKSTAYNPILSHCTSNSILQQQY